MQMPDDFEYYAKLYYILTPEQLVLGEEWCKEYVKFQLQKSFANLMRDFEKDWPQIKKNCAHPPSKKTG